METNLEAKTKVKKKRKRRGWIITLIIVAVLGIGGTACWIMVSMEHKDAANLPIEVVDFSKLKDGTYIGDYAGGIFGWRENEVQVTVSSGRVTEIKLLSSTGSARKNMEKKKKQDMLYDSVIKAQSLQVDTISGATLTSKAYLKAVEDALLKAQK